MFGTTSWGRLEVNYIEQEIKHKFRNLYYILKIIYSVIAIGEHKYKA